MSLSGGVGGRRPLRGLPLRRLSPLRLLLLPPLLLLLALAGSGARAQSCALPGEQRVDCGYVGIGQTECEAAGCCWSPLTVPGEDYPWCFYKDLDVCEGYSVVGRRETNTGFELTLNLTAP